MNYWGDIARVLEDADPICPSRITATVLRKAVATDGVEGVDAGSAPDGVVEAVCAIDRAWLAQLGQDPDISGASLEQATAFCRGVRAAHSCSTPPLRYARVEFSTVLGPRNEALRRLRGVRLFSFGRTNTGAVLATIHMHNDYSGIISTTTVIPKRTEADPVESARGLGAVLAPYLAHQRTVEVEDTFTPLNLLHLPDAVSPQSLADGLKYLGLFSQWQRAIALTRRSPMKTVSEASVWQLMNTVVGLVLVMRATNRTDYGKHILGASLSWTMLRRNLEPTAWDTVGHACDVMTSPVRDITHRPDVRNGDNSMSYRIKMRMVTEVVGLVSQSYGTVTSTVSADRARLRNQRALLEEVHGLLMLSRSYGMESVRQRAMSTAKTVNTSLPEVVDDSTLELVVDLRLVSDRLLTTLGANERAEKERLDIAELSLSQGWTEVTYAALALASHAAQVYGDHAPSGRAWHQCHDAMESWPMSRPGKRYGILVSAVSDPLIVVQILSVLAEVLVDRVEEGHPHASITREIISQVSEQASQCVNPP